MDLITVSQVMPRVLVMFYGAVLRFSASSCSRVDDSSFSCISFGWHVESVGGGGRIRLVSSDQPNGRSHCRFSATLVIFVDYSSPVTMETAEGI